MMMSLALTSLVALAPVDSAGAHSECCFELTAFGVGDSNVTWTNQQPPSPAPLHTGSEQFEWRWETREFDEYSEQDGFPSLTRPEIHEQETKGLADGTFSSAKSFERYWAPGVATPDVCNNTDEPGRFLTSEDFNRIDQFDSVPPAVQKRFKAAKYLLQLVSGGNLVDTSCFDLEGGIDEGLIPPHHPDGSYSEDEQPEGPGVYYVTLPPRAFLRHSRGQASVLGVRYDDAQNFSACDGPTVPGCDRYSLSETSMFHAEFKWFPEAELRRYYKQLGREVGPGHLPTP